MMRVRTLYLILFLLLAWSGRCEMISPLKIPLLLSANYGELRPNHFHGGIDLKTQGRTGLPIYAMDEGYISRVSASPWGYGRAVYINHPSGLTTVYGHLESFAPFIDKIIRQKQYEQEEFAIDCQFAEGEIPVKQGEVIGLSGNSGSSGGPHLHLEVRDTPTQDPLDPQKWVSQWITDEVPPEIRRLVFYSHNNATKNNRVERKAKRRAEGVYAITDTVAMWGDVSLGIEAYDRMSKTHNIYGVHRVDLYIDDSLFFSTDMVRYTFDETRYINSYAEGGKVMRTYIAPGNRLKSIYAHVENQGILHINEERIYRCRYELTDFSGNRSTVQFALLGKIQEPVAPQKSGLYFSYAVDNSYKRDRFSLTIPQGALYDNIDFTRKRSTSKKYYSDIHSLAPASTLLHRSAEISIPLVADSLLDKSKYYMVRLRGKRLSPVIGSYQEGFYTAKIRNFGKYAIAVDTIAPSIEAINLEKWKQGTITLKISDKESGLKSYRGEIDGAFVLFELDGKSGRITYQIEQGRVKQGGRHTLQVTVIDACENQATHRESFTW